MPADRKQITFDLDTKALEKYYPGDSWNNAYEIIKRHMIKHDFVWLQGSVYVSKNPLASRKVTIILDELVENHSWFHLCMRDCRETNIGKEHSKNHVFNKG